VRTVAALRVDFDLLKLAWILELVGSTASIDIPAERTEVGKGVLLFLTLVTLQSS